MAKLLVIDDEEAFRQLLREVLEQDGHQVWEADNGAAGLDIIRRQALDLAIVDVVMPKKGGIELLMELQHEPSDLKIIIMSGKIDTDRDSFQLLVRQLGAPNILRKPFDLDELRSRIKALLAA